MQFQNNSFVILSPLSLFFILLLLRYFFLIICLKNLIEANMLTKIHVFYSKKKVYLHWKLLLNKDLECYTGRKTVYPQSQKFLSLVRFFIVSLFIVRVFSVYVYFFFSISPIFCSPALFNSALYLGIASNNYSHQASSISFNFLFFHSLVFRCCFLYVMHITFFLFCFLFLLC